MNRPIVLLALILWYLMMVDKQVEMTILFTIDMVETELGEGGVIPAGERGGSEGVGDDGGYDDRVIAMMMMGVM